MGFRVMMIESMVEIRLKLENLVLDKGEGEIWVPLTDISMIVIDNLKTSISARMMSAFAENGIGVIFCDQSHQPVGVYNAYSPHSRASKILEYQIIKGKDKYDEMWEKTVRSKIRNQSTVLEMLEFPKERADEINTMANEIVRGDQTNREAHAAKVYFNTMMGTSFSRGNDDILLNSGLDYGYAIVRAFIARLCTGYGLNCQLGMHHKNEYNHFNLADDLIEPIRPFVDYLAFQILDGEEYFKREHRHLLVNILNHLVEYKGKKMYVCNMIEEYIKQYAAWVQNKCDDIEFPDVSRYLGDEQNEV